MGTTERPDPSRVGRVLAAHGERISVLALAAASLVMAAWLLREGRDLVFFFDEWDFLLQRRDGTDGLFDDHNGHFSLVPVVIYKLLFHTVGVEDYWVYRLICVAGHVLCVALIYAVVRQRADWPTALTAAILLLVLGAAWQVLLWPFQISYLASIAAGLGALIALERESRRADAAVAALVLVALASSGIGLAVGAGVLAELLTHPQRRARVWAAAAPLAAYGVWYLAASPESEAKRGNVDAIPGYVAEAAAGAVGAVSGLGLEWGRIVLVALVAAVALRLVSPGPLSPRLVGLLTAGVAYWGLTALARADLNEPLASRYLYFGVVVVLLTVVELVRTAELPARAWTLVALAVAAAGIANLGDLRDGARGLGSTTDQLRPALAAVELAGAAVPEATQPDPSGAPQITAGAYRELVADLGSPIGGPGAVLDDGPAATQAVDGALAQVLGIAAVPTASAEVEGAPPAARAILGRMRISGACVRYEPGGPGSALDVQLPSGDTLVVTAAGGPTELRLRRMAAEFPAKAFAMTGPGASVRIAVPGDRIKRPWTVRLSPPAPVSACSGVS